ncbi:MAG: MFS transporter [Chloroflexi bacterium]|nr:MFS transporter [Chloroflexota bacterium]
MDIQPTEPSNGSVSTSWKAPFFTIWTGQAFSLLGSMLVQFALVWWLTASTGSATVLATATLVALLPQIFLSPFAGALVDRWNRRIVMMVADSTIALFSLGLVYLYASGNIQLWHVYAVMLIRSAGGAFHWPAMQASTSLMVPEKQLSRVAGLNQMLQGVMSIVAPALGAVLLGVLPMYGVLLIDVFTAMLAVLPLFFIAVPQPPRTTTEGAPRGSMLHDLRDGLRYVWHWPGLLIVCVMATVINFLVNPAFSLLPILVTKHFGGEAIQLGLINSMLGVGMVAGGLLLSVWGGFRRRVFTSMVGLVGMGIGIAVVGIAPANGFGLAVAAMLLTGLMNPITNGPLFATLQSRVAPEMQGRVMSLLSAASTAVSPLSLAIAGPVADALGVQLWYVLGGVVCALMGVAGFFIPALVNLEGPAQTPVVAAVPASEPRAGETV